MTKMRLRSPSSGKHPFLAAARSPGAGQAHQPQLSVAKTSPFSLLGVSFNSVYTQIWRVLLHLAADPYPDVSDLAMKVLNSIAYKVRVTAFPAKLPSAWSPVTDIHAGNPRRLERLWTSASRRTRPLFVCSFSRGTALLPLSCVRAPGS